jgi:hypothetical protein
VNEEETRKEGNPAGISTEDAISKGPKATSYYKPIGRRGDPGRPRRRWLDI